MSHDYDTPKLGRFMLMRSEFKYDFDPATKKYTRKQGANPKAPDYFGSILLDLVPGAPPVVLRISGWVRKSDKEKDEGRCYLSGEIKYDKTEERRIDIKGLPEEAPPADEEVRDENYSSNTKLEDLPF